MAAMLTRSLIGFVIIVFKAVCFLSKTINITFIPTDNNFTIIPMNGVVIVNFCFNKRDAFS